MESKGWMIEQQSIHRRKNSQKSLKIMGLVSLVGWKTKFLSCTICIPKSLPHLRHLSLDIGTLWPRRTGPGKVGSISCDSPRSHVSDENLWAMCMLRVKKTLPVSVLATAFNAFLVPYFLSCCPCMRACCWLHSGVAKGALLWNHTAQMENLPPRVCQESSVPRLAGNGYVAPSIEPTRSPTSQLSCKARSVKPERHWCIGLFMSVQH